MFNSVRRLAFPVIVLSLALTACSKPNQGAIITRKQNGELRQQIDQLQKQHEADVASMKALESRNGSTVPTLPSERIAQLFTTHGLQFGRLTGPDPDNPGAIKVYVVPTDAAGEPLKAAGSFVVEAFDLSAKAGGENRIGRAEFPLDQAAKNWFGKAMLYTYVLPVPLEKPPGAGEVTVRVTFTDALTGREFSAQQVIKMNRG